MTAAEAGLAIASVLLLALVLVAVRGAARRYDLDAELARKLVHVAVGLYALTFPLLFTSPAAVALVAALSLALLLAIRLGRDRADGLGSALHGVARHSYGEVLFGIAVAILFFRSEGRPVLYVLPVAVLTLADAAAALAGSAYGRRMVAREEGRKSLEGAAVFFLVAMIVAMVALLLLSDAGRGAVVALGLVVALFGTLVEADSWLGFDNLFVPVALHLVLERLIGAEVAVIFGVALAALLAWLAAQRLGPRLGLSVQAASAFAITAFTLLATTDPRNAVLPLLAFAAHRLARDAAPAADQLPDLRALAMIVATALVFLVAGEALGLTAINHFALAFLGIAVVYLALSRRRPGAAAVIGGLAALACWVALAGNVDEGAALSEAYPYAAIVALGVAVAAPLLAGSWFARARALKAALAGAGPALLAFLAETL